MMNLTLTTAAVRGLDIATNERDLLRDLLIYLDYMQAHSVKRMVRTNELPRADLTRLAKQLNDPEIDQEWIYFIDFLALSMGLVSFDTRGEYRGYSSSEPSFVNNFVIVNSTACEEFFNRLPAEQEKQMIEALVIQRKRSEYDSSNNEFYARRILGRLDSFSPRGSAAGVMPSLDFTQVRRFLLGLLQQCPPGVWYTTASLVAFLKANHPYFLIPEKLPPDRWGHAVGRYENFYEGRDQWGNSDSFVPAGAPDAFERVEGRYVERFLEGIPLTMRFVDVAYQPQPQQTIYPSLGQLMAFRVNERFVRLMKGQIEPPRVTVQPNFDVVVESELYPARLMQTLNALAEIVSAPVGSSHASVITFQLKKDRIAAEKVRNPGLDVVGLLQDLTGRDLPPNVIVELEEWSGHADQFTLFTGFGLLESDEPLHQVDRDTAERISSHFRLVRHPESVNEKLEKAGVSPLWVKHGPACFDLLPDAARTIFPKKATAPVAPRGPARVNLLRTAQVTLYFSTHTQAFEDFRKALAEARCPIQADAANNTITFSQQYQPQFEGVVQQLAEKYQVDIQDLMT